MVANDPLMVPKVKIANGRKSLSHYLVEGSGDGRNVSEKKN